MSRTFRVLSCWLLGCSFALLLLTATPSWAEDPAEQLEQEQKSAAYWKQKLETVVDVRFDEKPLIEVVDQLRERHKLEIVLDRRCLKESGVGTDKTVTLQLKQVTLQAALRHILRPFDFTYTFEGETLLIRRSVDADAESFTRVYPVDDLIDVYSQGGKLEVESGLLEEFVIERVLPDYFSELGAERTLFLHKGMLIVRRPASFHEALAERLKVLRKLLKDLSADRPDQLAPIRIPSPNPPTERLLAALDKRVSLKFDKTTLSKVLETLREEYGVNTVVDFAQLSEVEGLMRRPVTYSCQKIPLRSALEELFSKWNLLRRGDLLENPLQIFKLGPLPDWNSERVQLGCGVRDEALFISLAAEFAGDYEQILYPVPDLVGDVEEYIYMDLMTLVGLVDDTNYSRAGFGLRDPRGIDMYPQHKALIVSYSHAQQQKIREKLALLRKRPEDFPQLASSKEIEPNSVQAVVFNLTYKETTVETHAGQFMSNPPKPDMKQLGQLITDLVAPETWRPAETAADLKARQHDQAPFLRALPDQLVIRHTDQVHEEVRYLLEQMEIEMHYPAAPLNLKLQFSPGAMFFNVPPE